jgi:hypothetical protein
MSDAEIDSTAPDTAVPPLDVQISIFEQTNEHMRVTEMKSLQIASVHVTVVGIALSVAFSRSEPLPGYIMAAILFSLAAMSYISFAIQDWYRAWKAHYVRCAAATWSRFDVDRRCVPYWLRTAHYDAAKRERVSVDNWLAQCTLYIARILATAGLVALATNGLSGVHPHRVGYVVAFCVGLVAVAYIEIKLYRLLESKNAMLREP